MNRMYDICIFGGSGYTGEYVIADLAVMLNKEEKDLKWAVAGRNESKLKESLKTVSSIIGMDLSHIPIIVATVGDNESLNNMALQSKVLINCTGPFRYYGEDVVVACLRNGCHYLDITGEPKFMEIVQLKYHDEALEKGIYIVPGCGFDSIPCDIGVNFIRDSFKGRLATVETFLSGIGSVSANATTWDCAVEGLGDVGSLIKVRKALYEKMFSEPSKVKPVFPAKKKTLFSYSDDRFSGWAIPFQGADRSVIKRSQMHNYLLFGEKNMISMEPYMVQSFMDSMSWFLMGLYMMIFTKWSWGRTLLHKFPGFFSSGMFVKGGPKREEIDNGSFAITFKGRGWKDGQDTTKPPKDDVVARIEGPHPGYPTCAICVNQSALVMLKEQDKLPLSGGVFTPATAFRKSTIIDRLNAHKVTFKVVPSSN